MTVTKSHLGEETLNYKSVEVAWSRQLVFGVCWPGLTKQAGTEIEVGKFRGFEYRNFKEYHFLGNRQPYLCRIAADLSVFMLCICIKQIFA